MSGAETAAGKRWEAECIAYARSRGMPWDRRLAGAPLDILDTDGSLPMGWLVGYKTIIRGHPVGTRLWQAMDQAEHALEALFKLNRDTSWVIPFQVLRRPAVKGHGKLDPGVPAVARAYAVTEFRWFLDLVEMRRDNQWPPYGKRNSA